MIPSTSLASISRVFLSPVLTGWHGPDGIIHFPMNMEAKTQNIGIHVQDDLSLTEWMNSHRDRFASTDMEWAFYHTPDTYQDAVHPTWLRKVQSHMSDTISEYAASLPEISRLRRPISLLQSRWAEIQATMSAVLYMENPGRSSQYTLFPQDLTLFGPEISDVNNVELVSDLLETVTHVDHLLREGMTDIIDIQDEEGNLRRLHDAVASPEDSLLTLVGETGAETKMAKNLVRPICVYQLDDDLRINPFQSGITQVHPAYDAFQQEMTRMVVQIRGAYLMAHFKWDEKDFQSLQGDALVPEAVASRLKRTGRMLKPANTRYADILAAYLTRLGQAS